MLIVGIDFSSPSAAAALEARALAARLGLAFRCAHIRQFQAAGPWSPTFQERIWMETAAVAEDEVAMRWGTPWVELVRLATELRAQMIVVGTHGHSGFQPIGLGSTAARLALLSPIPTLLVGGRDRPRGEDWRTFVNHTTETRGERR
jgi:nucleotide-binding universal stress UspA family protein